MSQEELLQKLERIEAAITTQEGLRDALPEEQLKSVLVALENQRQTLLAKLEGAGAIAQGDGAKAVGKQGMLLEGDVDTGGGDFTGRDKNVTIYQGRYEGDVPRSASERRHIYNQYIAQQAGVLPLRGMDRVESDAENQRHTLSLSGVYTSLDIQLCMPERIIQSMLENSGWQNIEFDQESKLGWRMAHPKREKDSSEDTRPVSALEATTLSRKLVLLGDPGSGKTTFLNYLTQVFAQEKFGEIDTWPEDERDLLLIVVVLRDFYRWLQSQESAPNANLLWKFICHDLETKNLSFAEPILETALEDGKALVLLDGLDEVPPDQARLRVRNCVIAFHTRYRKNRFLITCRVLSYQEPKWQLPQEDFHSFQLASFDEEKINKFIQAWYNEVAQKWQVPPERIQTLANKLKLAIKRPDLARLAPTPLLLTVMALVHTEYGELPDNRAQLYQQAVDVLLWRWEQAKTKAYGGQSQMMYLLQDAERDRNDLLDVLSRLAFEAHEHGGDTQDPDAVSGISQMDLLGVIRELHPERIQELAEEVVVAMSSFPAGHTLEEGDVALAEMPVNTLPDDALTDVAMANSETLKLARSSGDVIASHHLGGGNWPNPGEISLAHRGVLFLDEFPEFGSCVIEVLRQPLEDKQVTISRAQGSLTFPSNFQLIAAMNPCPCGYYGDGLKACTCSNSVITRYQKRISGPMLDRIDMHVEVPRVDYDKLSDDRLGEPSAHVQGRVEAARERQRRRFGESASQRIGESAGQRVSG